MTYVQFALKSLHLKDDSYISNLYLYTIP